MNTIFKKIEFNTNDIVFKATTSNLDDILDIVIDDEIFDIKDYNDVEKIVLDVFINKYVYLNPSVSKHSLYNYILYKKIEIINYNNISTSFYVYQNIFSYNKINKDKNIKNILHIGLFPNVLEAYNIYNNNNLYNSDFIQSYKYSNNNLYDTLLERVSKNIRNFTLINKLNNNEYINLNIIKKKYNIIFFNNYKNILYFSNYNINEKSLSSIIHFKYILNQIIFILNSLEKDGEFIILMSAYNNKIYSQIVYIIKLFFKEVNLFHSEIDLSYRIFLIGKKFYINDNNIDIFNRLNNFYNDIKLDNKNILINIIENYNYDNNYNDFIENLKNKFSYIYSKIKSTIDIFSDEKILNKLHYYYYNYQLKNTLYFLINNINKIYINDNFKLKIKNFEKDIFFKIIIKRNKYFEISENIYFYKFYIINKILSNQEFYEIIKPLKFLNIYENIIYDDIIYQIDKYYHIIKQVKLYNEIYEELKYIISNHKFTSFHIIDIIQYIYNNENSNLDNILYSGNIEGINGIFNYYNIKNIIYIDFSENNLYNINYIFDKYDYVIKFSLKTITPLLLSIFYILSKYFKECFFIKISLSVYKYFFICKKYNNIKIGKINDILNNSNDKMTYLVQINEKFINDFNNIIYNLLISELKNSILIKYIFINNLIDTYKLSIDKKKIIKKYLKTIIL